MTMQNSFLILTRKKSPAASIKSNTSNKWNGVSSFGMLLTRKKRICVRRKNNTNNKRIRLDYLSPHFPGKRRMLPLQKNNTKISSKTHALVFVGEQTPKHAHRHKDEERFSGKWTYPSPALLSCCQTMALCQQQSSGPDL